MEKLKPMGRWFRPVVVTLGTLLLLGAGYGMWWYHDTPPLDRYAPLLAQMAAHHVKIDDTGRVDLSKSFPGLTPQDQAFIRWREDGTFLAMFPTFIGEGRQIAGLVYTSRPLRDDDTRLRDVSISFNERLIGVGTYENLVLEKQINPNWYHVSYKLH